VGIALIHPIAGRVPAWNEFHARPVKSASGTREKHRGSAVKIGSPRCPGVQLKKRCPLTE
jgi:hypothetical protein